MNVKIDRIFASLERNLNRERGAKRSEKSKIKKSRVALEKKLLSANSYSPFPIDCHGPAVCSHYAVEILKDRFPSGEELISQDAEAFQPYLEFLRKKLGRQVLKDVCMTNSTFAVWYADEVVRGRWKSGEQVILKNLEDAIYYAESRASALKILKPVGHFLKQDPRYSARYARLVGKKAC